MHGREIREFHVFLSSPGDVPGERRAVRDYFENFNRTAGLERGVRFQVIDWSNFASAGAGRPQELITGQTLERFRASLALVVVVMAQRFGTPSGEAESGTEEEARWALRSNTESGFPEVKFFFRDVEHFTAPADPRKLIPAVEQWQRVVQFRAEIESERSALVRTYADADDFETVFRTDLDNWFFGEDRPWHVRAETPAIPAPSRRPAPGYFTGLVRAYKSLDISGIDSDRAFDLPLDKVYVRLRVISGGDDDAASFTIQTALERYQRLVIVGDPGSGKSTFLRFIALTLAQSHLTGDTARAAEQLSLHEPLPVPVFISCWDLSEHLRKVDRGTLHAVTGFIGERLTEAGWPIDADDVGRMLDEGRSIVLIDGLDEVPTEGGRHLVAKLIDELVERHPANRYVVTSRIRAYTGGTTLGGQFARCDIQPFGRDERTAFLRNWVEQLFRVRGGGDLRSAEAVRELTSLSGAIEASSIRSLAVNPLLLTVIAIVHWNRKRLPEQRVDLYDECIDVLLGQRKEAERQQTARDTRVLDETYSEERLDQRAWVRKRFAEIAFTILSRSDEEIDRGAVIALLEPHFSESADPDPDTSRRRAEHFLDRQELRSGLLVRRRMASYRFVHLTFQEYLAAWFLASRDLGSTLTTIEPHLRDPKWFEALQLLGGALANRSDEGLDRYVDWLLDRVGETVREQAPVIALAANIVRDTQSVANLSSGTQARYESFLRKTFHAFEPDSRVPKQTQLELLEALGGLGASVKDQLLAATGARLLEIRRRAVEMLVPHLADDDLFAMTHILNDRSKEPIKTYLNALVARDRTRAGRLVLDARAYGDKTLDALFEGPNPRLPAADLENWPELIAQFATRFGRHDLEARNWRAVWLVHDWSDERQHTWTLVDRLGRAGCAAALEAMLDRRCDPEQGWEVVNALDDEAAHRLVDQYQSHDELELARSGLIQSFADRWTRQKGLRELLVRLAELGSQAAARELAVRWNEHDETWEILTRLAADGRAAALQALLDRPDQPEGVWRLISDLSDEAVDRLADWGSYFAPADIYRAPLLHSLVTTWVDRDESLILVTRMVKRSSPQTMRALVREEGQHAGSWKVFLRLAETGDSDAVRFLIQKWPDRAATWDVVDSLDDEAVRLLAAHRTSVFDYAMVPGETTAWNQRPEGRRLLIRVAGAGSMPALQVLLDQQKTTKEGLLVVWNVNNAKRAIEARLRKAEDGQELITQLAEAGHCLAAQVLLDQEGAREETWAMVRGFSSQTVGRLADFKFHYSGRETSQAGFIRSLTARWSDRSEARELLARLAEAGQAAAIRLLIERHADTGTENWNPIRRLNDDAFARLSDYSPDYVSRDRYQAAFVNSVLGQESDPGDDLRALMTRLAETGQKSALRALTVHWSDQAETWELVERLADGGDTTALEILLEQSRSRERSRISFSGLVLKGQPAAFLVLLGNADERETRDLIRQLSDDAVRRLAQYQPSPPRWGRYNSPVVQSLMDSEVDEETKRELIARLAEAGVISALSALVDRWDDREDTWDLVRRFAEDAHIAALRALLAAPEREEEFREVVGSLVGKGRGKARVVGAWLDWAMSTGGPSSAQSLLRHFLT
jgi:energy-coupling factor transporter ATP-binding protein EcfA2